MGSNPIDTATIRATAQRVVDEWANRFGWTFWGMWHQQDQERLCALVQAGADLAAQSHATALADAEREAARRAWDAARDWEQVSQFAVKTPSMFDDARDRYLAREYPAPAPREEGFATLRAENARLREALERARSVAEAEDARNCMSCTSTAVILAALTGGPHE